jgi:hypothetical protein
VSGNPRGGSIRVLYRVLAQGNHRPVFAATAGFDVAVVIGRWFRFAKIDQRLIVLPVHEF